MSENGCQIHPPPRPSRRNADKVEPRRRRPRNWGTLQTRKPRSSLRRRTVYRGHFWWRPRSIGFGSVLLSPETYYEPGPEYTPTLEMSRHPNKVPNVTFSEPPWGCSGPPPKHVVASLHEIGLTGVTFRMQVLAVSVPFGRAPRPPCRRTRSRDLDLHSNSFPKDFQNQECLPPP